MRVSKCCALFLILVSMAAAPILRAQNIHVDITPSHSTNTIKPTEALGAGIDRLPYGAADKMFVEDTIKQILSAGWQTVTYRQNTELHVEAWHWNPQGGWSDPAGKGYFTGSAIPGTDLVRHSYGYPLPRRGFTRNEGTENEGYSRLTDGVELLQFAEYRGVGLRGLRRVEQDRVGDQLARAQQPAQPGHRGGEHVGIGPVGLPPAGGRGRPSPPAADRGVVHGVRVVQGGAPAQERAQPVVGLLQGAAPARGVERLDPHPVVPPRVGQRAVHLGIAPVRGAVRGGARGREDHPERGDRRGPGR